MQKISRKLYLLHGRFDKILLYIGAEAAVLLEPMGVAHNAIEQVEPSGEDVLIIGCGPIGVLACSIAKALGAKR